MKKNEKGSTFTTQKLNIFFIQKFTLKVQIISCLSIN